MRNRGLGLVGGVALILAFGFTPNASANTSPLDTSVKKSLKWVKPLELPYKAACLLKATDCKKQEVMGEAILQATMDKCPSALPAVLGALVQVTPDAAGNLVAWAVQLCPKQVDMIAQAAIEAAPTYGCVQQVLWALEKKVPGWKCPSWLLAKYYDKHGQKDYHKKPHKDKDKGHYEKPC